tara:strand:- start:613 stop:828 length:216 start_codon:yes stop_codon:yes gene_type:complete
MLLSTRILKMAKKKSEETGAEYPLILEGILKELLHGFSHKELIKEVEGLLQNYKYDFILEELVKEAMHEYN